MTYVFWCQNHGASAPTPKACYRGILFDAPCLISEEQVVPVHALVIKKEEDGTWPKKARQRVASALGEAVGHQRRNTLTVETFVGIGDFLLDNLASGTDLNVKRIIDALAADQVGEPG